MLILLSLACTTPSAPLDPLAEQGRTVYQANCTACHNSDPNKVGTVGPAVAGSSRALLEARIVRGEYPPGYTPKRETHAMAAMPHLAGDVDALTAYLAK